MNLVSFVVQSYDYFLYGNRLDSLVPLSDGGYRITQGLLLEAFQSLKTIQDGIKLVNPILYLPRVTVGFMTPEECRLRMSTYQVEIRATLEMNEKPQPSSVFVGYVPLIVGSSVHPQQVREDGIEGYYIVNGRERVIRNYEYRKLHIPLFQPPNRVIVVQQRHHYQEEVVLLYDEDKRQVYVQLAFGSKDPLKISLQTALILLGETLPVHSLFPGDYVQAEVPMKSLQECQSLVSQRIWGHTTVEAIVLNRWLFDHLFCFFGESRSHRRALLVKCARKLIHCYYGQEEKDDWDALHVKRVVTGGDLLAQLVKSKLDYQWNLFAKKLTAGLNPSQVETLFHDTVNVFTKSIRTALLQGIFSSNLTGITQSLDRSCNRLQAWAQITRTNLPLMDQNPNITPRMVHGTQWGFQCPFETPEGQRIGLVKQIAFTALITTPGDVETWRMKLLPICDANSFRHPRLVLNQIILGTLRSDTDPYQYVRNLKKQMGWPFASVIVDPKTESIEIDISGGRWIRPVLTTAGATLVIDWDNLLTKGGKTNCIIWGAPAIKRYGVNIERLLEYDPQATVWDMGENEIHILPSGIEWIDPTEQYYRYSEEGFQEPHGGSFLFGLSAGRTPFLNRNAAPRDQFAAHTSHQAIGNPLPVGEPNFRTAPVNDLYYNQKPLCETLTAWYLNEPTGINVLVFIMALPENEEDSVVVNRSFLERGGFRHHCQVGFREVLESHEILEDVIEIGTKVQKKTELLSKRHRDHPDMKITAESKYEGEDLAIVEAVSVETDDLNRTVVNIRLGYERCAIAGDKLMSRHGQKHIISKVKNQEDLPHTLDGMHPDLVISPLGLPSRMTMGQLIESLVSMATLIRPPLGFHRTGLIQTDFDPTAYSPSFSLPQVQTTLKNAGLQILGEQCIMDGEQGMGIIPGVTVGFVYYQRSVHQVNDKVRATAEAERCFETRQPIQASDGGLRIGVDESLRLIEHGATKLLQELFTKSSDGMCIRFCLQCQQGQRNLVCCQKQTVELTVPYSFWVTLKKLQVVGIDISLLQVPEH
jgi:DNA-directed RNA polymerase subunit B